VTSKMLESQPSEPHGSRHGLWQGHGCPCICENLLTLPFGKPKFKMTCQNFKEQS
jgi:hypothetical protein